MSLYAGRKTVSVILGLLLALMVASALLSSLGKAQQGPPKLTKQQVIDLLTGDVPSDEVAKEARKSGISFQVTASVEREIQGAGGSDALIKVLHELAPPGTPPAEPAASAPVLMIEATPGQSQVYVDDEPEGSTSREGRLKLTRLAPGPHTVRISLNGYDDHEEKITLAAGMLTTVAASLQKTAVAPISPAPPPPQTPSTSPMVPPAKPKPANGQPGDDVNPVRSAGLGAVPVSCEAESTLRSPASSTPLQLRMVNATSSIRKVYWLNYTGQRIPYATLQPQSSYLQSTFVAHIWLITDSSNRCVAVFQPERTDSVVRIDR